MDNPNSNNHYSNIRPSPIVRAKPASLAPPSTDGKPAAVPHAHQWSVDPSEGMVTFPAPPSHKPEDAILTGLCEKDKERVALRKQFVKDHQADKSTPYKTKEQYQKRIQECRHYGKLVKFTSKEDPHGEKFEYHQHPFNSFMYSCLDKSKEVLTLLTRSQSQGEVFWKRNLHEELHQIYIAKAYKAVLDGGLQELRGAHSAESNRDGLHSVVFKLFLMSGENGKEVSKFWGSKTWETLHKTWIAEKERVKAAEVAEKRRVKAAEKAERKRLKEEEKAAAKKRRKTQQQQTIQFSSPVINNNSGSATKMNLNFFQDASPEVLKFLGLSPATSDK